jgi:hypothetical protein
MIKKLLFIALLATIPVLSNAQTQVLVDTSLEATGGGSSDWASTSVAFTTVLCSVADCGICGGPCAPHSGTYYAWFGGNGPITGEEGTLTQAFNVTATGNATLNFWLMLPITGIADDSLSAFIDGAMVWFKLGDDSAGFGTTYAPVSVQLGSLAAGIHTLEFRGIETGNASTVFNILVDDITISVDDGTGIADYDFENGVTLYANHQEHILNCAFDLPRATDLTVRISDMLGREKNITHMRNVKKDYVTFNTYGLADGVYNVTFIKKDMVFTKRVFIQQ